MGCKCSFNTVEDSDLNIEKKDKEPIFEINNYDDIIPVNSANQFGGGDGEKQEIISIYDNSKLCSSPSNKKKKKIILREGKSL